MYTYADIYIYMYTYVYICMQVQIRISGLPQVIHMPRREVQEDLSSLIVFGGFYELERRCLGDLASRPGNGRYGASYGC